MTDSPGPSPSPAPADRAAPDDRAAAVVLDELDHRLLSVLQANADLSNLELARRVHTSPPTCLRRVRRLKALGIIERQVVLLAPGALGPTLTAIIEVTLDNQTEGRQGDFAARVTSEGAILQSYRVSPGPDFVLLAQVADMSGYQQLAQRLFGPGSNVRNVRTYFALARTKFETRLANPHPAR